jgi:hypothetical protein
MPHTYSPFPTIQKKLKLLLQGKTQMGNPFSVRPPPTPNIRQVWPRPKQSTPAQEREREREGEREREQRRSRVSPPHSSSPALPSVEPPPSPAKPEPPPRHELAQSRHCHRPRAKLLRRRAGHKLTRSHRHRRFSCSSTTDVLAKLFDHLIQSADHLRHDVGEQKKLDLITIHCSCSNRSYRSQK